MESLPCEQTGGKAIPDSTVGNLVEFESPRLQCLPEQSFCNTELGRMKNAAGLPLTERKRNPRLGAEGKGSPHLFGGASPEESFHHIELVGVEWVMTQMTQTLTLLRFSRVS